MPNWCSTIIRFYGKDVNEEIQDFYNKIEKWTNEPTAVEKGWGGDPKWLGNIIARAYDMPYEDLAEKEGSIFQHVDHRGDIYDVDICTVGYEDVMLTVWTETAWYPMIKMWEMLIEHLYPGKDIKIAYMADEPGCEVYIKYDPDLMISSNKESYNVEIYIEGKDPLNLGCYNEECSRKEVEEILEQLGIDKSEIDNLNLNDMIDEKMGENGYDEDSYCQIYKYYSLV